MGAAVSSTGVVPYAGMDFRGDPDLFLPLGGAWGELGNFLFSNFQIFMNYIHMYKSSNPINMSKCRYWTSPP